MSVSQQLNRFIISFLASFYLHEKIESNQRHSACNATNWIRLLQADLRLSVSLQQTMWDSVIKSAIQWSMSWQHEGRYHSRKPEAQVIQIRNMLEGNPTRCAWTDTPPHEAGLVVTPTFLSGFGCVCYAFAFPGSAPCHQEYISLLISSDQPSENFEGTIFGIVAFLVTVIIAQYCHSNIYTRITGFHRNIFKLEFALQLEFKRTLQMR